MLTGYMYGGITKESDIEIAVTAAMQKEEPIIAIAVPEKWQHYTHEYLPTIVSQQLNSHIMAVTNGNNN